MHLVSVEFSQIALLANIISSRGTLYFPEVLKAVTERYGFVKVPQTLEEVRDPNGALFAMGKFKESVIDQLKVLPYGMLVQSKAHIEQAEDFLDDLLEWVADAFDMRVSNFAPVQRAYDSHLVVQLDIDLQKHFSLVTPICNSISALLGRYSGVERNYVQTGMIFHGDMSSLSGVKPPTFVLERRANVSYDRNLYFSSAPLRTSDHLAILSELEQLLLP